MTINRLVSPDRLKQLALLLSFVLLSAQTLAQQHIHIEDVPNEVCELCVQADTPGAAAQPLDSTTQWPVVDRTVRASISSTKSAFVGHYDTRAPPRT